MKSLSEIVLIMLFLFQKKNTAFVDYFQDLSIKCIEDLNKNIRIKVFL